MPHLRQSSPTGKSLLVSRNRVKPRNKKYFAFPEGRNSGISVAIPSRSEGRIMIVTNEGRVAVDADCAFDEGARGVRRRRVVLTPRCWRQVGGQSRRRWWQESRSPGSNCVDVDL